MGRLLAFLALLLIASSAFAGGGPAETVVLVNAASPESRRVADHYAARRDIPRAQVCEVKCATTLETTIEEFVQNVVDPLRVFLHERGLDERCRFVVLTQGMPILAKTPGGPVSTTAALSVLHSPLCGSPQTQWATIRNPYTAGPASGAPDVEGGRLLLTTALLSTTADEAIALVDRSVASDGTSPIGARFVFQDADGAAGVRDDKYDAARKDLEALAFTTDHEKQGPDVLKGKAKLMGFMSGGSYSQLSVEGLKGVRFLPGAIGDMLESFGAVPANFDRDAKNDAQFPVPHLIRAGITGVHGAVFEPHNYAFPDQTLFRSYVEGHTLAEAFHQKLIIVYWMNLVIGDPLCAPYAVRPVVGVKALETPWKDEGKIEYEAPGAVRVDVYDEGVHVATRETDRGVVRIKTSGWKPGEKRKLLVEATGAGAPEPRGWRTIEVSAAEPLPPQPSDALADPGLVEITSPTGVRAGDEFTVVAQVVDASGAPAKRGPRRIEVRTSSPPVRWAYVDTNEARAEFKLKVKTTGVFEFRGGADGKFGGKSVKILVEPGAGLHATCPATAFPLGQEGDLEVVVLDQYLNRITDYEGTLSMEVPEDKEAVLPEPVKIAKEDRGRGVFRAVTLLHPGQTILVLRDAAGKTLSVEKESVTVGPTPLRAWLVSPPTPAAQFASGDPSAAPKDMKRVVGEEVVTLAPAAKSGHSTMLLAYLGSVGATRARLLGAAPGKVRVLLDGKVVFDGALKATDARGRRDPIADLEMIDGVHRLAVIAETKGSAQACFEIDDGAGKFPPSLRIRTSE